MPSLYQLLPRSRHRPVEARERALEAPDLLDLDTWIRLRWGLADPMRAATLRMLLAEPGSELPRHRRQIALDHLDKCLKSARALQGALDIAVPGRPPHLKLHLFASDLVRTPAAAAVSRGGALLGFSRHGPGDRVVLARAPCSTSGRAMAGSPASARRSPGMGSPSSPARIWASPTTR